MSQIRILPSSRGFRVMVIVPPRPTGFQSTRAKERNRRTLRQRRRSLLDRMAPRPEPERPTPMITPANIHYELGRRVQGLAPGGIGALLLVAQSSSPPDENARCPEVGHPVASKRPAIGSSYAGIIG